jgi:YD repeat-containing protein
VSSGPDGSIYLTGSHRVRRIDPEGRITTVAGTGTAGFSGDGGVATSAQLSGPVAVAVAPDGSLLIADTGNHRVRQVDPMGIITTVAGTGMEDFSGDGGPATAAALWLPRGVAVGPDCALYISDWGNIRVRRVAPDGTISTVAGNGSFGFSGDGGPATAARLAGPQGVGIAPDGSLYIADDTNNRIRKVDPAGTITTVAGSGGIGGFSGDGGPATAALMRRPQSVAVTADGSLFIADFLNFRIRRVGPDGIISTLAGGGTGTDDGGPATAATLSGPTGVTVLADGRVAIGDPFDGLLRTVAAPLPGFSLGDLVLPDDAGRELYVFSPAGRHLRTLDALTAGTRWEFGYDGGGRLSTIADGDGNTTTIVRDPGGTPTAIVPPGGQQTLLSVDANGYLATIRTPAGETTSLTHTAGGLLTAMQTPRGQDFVFAYDPLGRLGRDDDPAGGFKTLERTGPPSDYTVALATAEGRTTTYNVTDLAAGGMRRTNTFPSGLQSTTEQGTDGERFNLPYEEVMAVCILFDLTINRANGRVNA